MNAHRLRLLVCGLVLTLAIGAIPLLGDLGLHARPMLALWGVAFGAYAAAAAWILRRPGNGALPIVLVTGLLARALLIPAAPTLSEDVYRYLWDGHLVARGANPFTHAPSDSALVPFRNDLLPKLNHADVPTIYPPAAQFLFGLTAAVSPTPVAWKVMLLLLETLLVLALLKLLRDRGLPEERLLLYYWNPLVLVESFGSGHLDLAAAAFLVLALAHHDARRRARAGTAMGIAIAIKYVPALLVPYFVRRKQWVLLAVVMVVTALLFLPFRSAGTSLFTGLITYARHWEFNGVLYRLLRRVIDSDVTVRRALAVGLLLTTVAIAWRARTASGAALAGLMAFVLFSPTVFPWYLVPVVALLPLHPDPGAILFSGLVALTYLPLPIYRATGTWSLPGWIPWVEYGGLGLVWALSAARARVHQREDAHVEESEEVEHEEG